MPWQDRGSRYMQAGVKMRKRSAEASVNWAQWRYSKTMPFRFAQVPGTKNALGKVKFLFPNKFSVYMHDTPTKHLFKRNKRAFSHGCIRLQKPRELMRTFSTFNDNLDFDDAQKILKGKKKDLCQFERKSAYRCCLFDCVDRL